MAQVVQEDRIQRPNQCLWLKHFVRLVGVAELCSPLLVLLRLSVRWGRGVIGAGAQRKEGICFFHITRKWGRGNAGSGLGASKALGAAFPNNNVVICKEASWLIPMLSVSDTALHF